MFENLVSRSATKRAVPANFADGAPTLPTVSSLLLETRRLSAAMIPKIQRPAAISIVGGTYSINGGTFVSTPGEIRPGNTLQVRVDATLLWNTDTSAAVTIGSQTATFTAKSRWRPNAADVPNMTLWFRPDELEAGALATWTDNALGSTATTSGGSPTVVGNSLNGWPTVSFDGNDVLRTLEIDEPHHHTGTFFIVAKVPNTGQHVLMGWNDPATGVRRAYIHPAWTTGDLYIDIGDAGAGRITMGSSPLDGANYFILSVVRTNTGGNGGVATAYNHGTSILTDTSLDDVLNVVANKRFSIGTSLDSAGNAEGNFLTGNIAEIITVDRALSDADRQKTEGYLAHKYGLTASLGAGHTYRASAP